MMRGLLLIVAIIHGGRMKWVGAWGEETGCHDKNPTFVCQRNIADCKLVHSKWVMQRVCAKTCGYCRDVSTQSPKITTYPITPSATTTVTKTAQTTTQPNTPSSTTQTTITRMTIQSITQPKTTSSTTSKTMTTKKSTTLTTKDTTTLSTVSTKSTTSAVVTTTKNPAKQTTSTRSTKTFTPRTYQTHTGGIECKDRIGNCESLPISYCEAKHRWNNYMTVSCKKYCNFC